MKGAVVDLPAPIGKTAAEAAPLKIERREVAGRPNEDLVTADYRGVVRVVAHRGTTGYQAMPDRVLVLLGSAAARCRHRRLARDHGARAASGTRSRRMARVVREGKAARRRRRYRARRPNRSR